MSDTGTMKNRLGNKLRDYLSAPLGDFYAFGVNRLLLYCLLTCFFLLAGILAWAVYISPHFLIKKMSFTTVYALHNAVAYALCHYLVDALANRLWPTWAGYEKRTVGRQWAVWSGGFVLGFILHRTMVRSLVPLYASHVIASFSNHPGFPPTHLTFALAMPPFWMISMAAVIHVALKRQKAQQFDYNYDFKAVLNSPADSKGVKQTAQEGTNEGASSGVLTLNTDAGELKIPHAHITHITVEDHYSRIFYAGGNGDGLRNVLIRLPLKKLMQELSSGAFVQIHRSHVVNLSHVARLEKTGRECRLVLSAEGIDLPVSRYRLPHIKPRLEEIGGV